MFFTPLFPTSKVWRTCSVSRFLSYVLHCRVKTKSLVGFRSGKYGCQEGCSYLWIVAKVFTDQLQLGLSHMMASEGHSMVWFNQRIPKTTEKCGQMWVGGSYAVLACQWRSLPCHGYSTEGEILPTCMPGTFSSQHCTSRPMCEKIKLVRVRSMTTACYLCWTAVTRVLCIGRHVVMQKPVRAKVNCTLP